jgi:hypothetical protein
MGEATLEFHFWKYSTLQWIGLRMATRGRDGDKNNVPLLKLDATTSKDTGD